MAQSDGPSGSAIIDRIRAAGGEVVRRRWQISIRRGRLDDAAMAWIARHYEQIANEVWPLREMWLERAAIMEYEGGLDREAANEAAYDSVVSRYARPVSGRQI